MMKLAPSLLRRFARTTFTSTTSTIKNHRRCLSSSQTTTTTTTTNTLAKPPLNILLVLGSSRTKRIGGKVAHHISTIIRSRGHSLSILDPRDPIHDDFFMRLMEKAYFHYKKDETIPPPLQAAANAVAQADAYVVVTPEYNHTISPALTNTMNYFGSSLYAQKASGICTYSAGVWGGARCGVALRPYLSELGCLPVSATCQITSAWKPGTFDDDTGLLNDHHMGAKSCHKMLEQLEWQAVILRDARQKIETEMEEEGTNKKTATT